MVLVTGWDAPRHAAFPAVVAGQTTVAMIEQPVGGKVPAEMPTTVSPGAPTSFEPVQVVVGALASCSGVGKWSSTLTSDTGAAGCGVPCASV